MNSILFDDIPFCWMSHFTLSKNRIFFLKGRNSFCFVTSFLMLFFFWIDFYWFLNFLFGVRKTGFLWKNYSAVDIFKEEILQWRRNFIFWGSIIFFGSYGIHSWVLRICCYCWWIYWSFEDYCCKKWRNIQFLREKVEQLWN